jgi:hypothetical protein
MHTLKGMKRDQGAYSNYTYLCLVSSLVSQTSYKTHLPIPGSADVNEISTSSTSFPAAVVTASWLQRLERRHHGFR